METLVGSRESSGNGSNNKADVLNMLLKNLGDSHTINLFMLAATNNRYTFDVAFSRRVSFEFIGPFTLFERTAALFPIAKEKVT